MTTHHPIVEHARRRSPREERRAATRDAIVAGTLSLLAEGGYGAASMHDVARRAGVATGSLYRHFPSKGELLAHVFRESAGRELATVGAAARGSAPPADRLRAAVETLAGRALASPTLTHALLSETGVDPAAEAARTAIRRAHEELLATVLADGVAAGAFAPGQDVRVTARALVGALHAAVVGARDPMPGRRTDGELAHELAAFALRAAGADPS